MVNWPGLREGAGGKVFPFGRWNREQRHNVEKISDGEAAWAQCSCNWMGPTRESDALADQDAEGHEREVFERSRRQGKRFVRGRWE